VIDIIFFVFFTFNQRNVLNFPNKETIMGETTFGVMHMRRLTSPSVFFAFIFSLGYFMVWAGFDGENTMRV